jgi:hypothetical protein
LSDTHGSTALLSLRIVKNKGERNEIAFWKFECDGMAQAAIV